MIFTDYVLIAVLVIMSIVAVMITCYDKRAAKAAPKRRTPERTLMLIALLFGSFAMYVTMQLIRHKTKHPKFMIGVPVCMAIDTALIAAYFIFLRPQLG
jgi:uncharacterized membrane protein YsdA (DUF1294 family)